MENHKEQHTEENQFVDQPDNLTDQPATPAEETASTSNDRDKVTAELAEMKDKYVRLYSDFDNFRRRTSKEKLDYLKSANEEILVALLPILDDFERAFKFSGDADGTSVAEGVQLVYQKLYKTLEQKGLKPMESIGQAFNPDFHEAITQSPAPTPDMKGKVIDEVEKGYVLNDKVIRFAKVIIGS